MSAQAAAAAAQQVGQIISGFGTWRAKRAQASNLRRAAVQARKDGSAEAQLAVDEAERAGARAAVVGAATGGGFDGSFGAVLDDLEQTGMFNARSAIYAGNVEANNRLYEAEIANVEGKMALVSAFVGTASSIAGQQMQAAENRKQVKHTRTLYTKGYGR